jgi:hypothetical protein
LVFVVGVPRLELGTSWSQTTRANQLRYTPMLGQNGSHGAPSTGRDGADHAISSCPANYTITTLHLQVKALAIPHDPHDLPDSLSLLRREPP